MKLSIIIPVYNVEKHISRCLESLFNQDLNEDEYEVLIIDDGSKDNSINLVEQHYLPSHKNIFVHRRENQGVGAARNKGLDLAKGKYIYFIDPDDYLADNVLKTLLDYSIKHKPDVLTFKSQATVLTNLRSRSQIPDSSFNITEQSGMDFIANHGFKNEVWWYFTKKSFLDSIGLRFIHGRWMEDAIFTAKLLVQAKRVISLPLDVHRHVKVEGSAMTSKEPNHYLKVIADNAHAAVVYESIISQVDQANKTCVKRLKSRQQSFVFFLLIRTLKSTMKKEDIFPLLSKMKSVGAYPLNAFLGPDYNSAIYSVLSKLFSNKYLYYFIFLMLNPMLKHKK